MSYPQPSSFTNRSIAALAGTSETLFPAKSEVLPIDGAIERIVHNPNAANDIWINPIGGAAVANGAGSIKIAAGGSFYLNNTDAVKVIGTAADKVTAYER